MKNEQEIKINIALITTPIEFGGTERVNLNFLNNYNKTKFNIEVFLYIRPWEPEKQFEHELKKMGIKYYLIPVAISLKIDIFRLVRCYICLYNLIKGKSYHIIHTHGYLANIFGIIVSKRLKIPIISTCHGFINNTWKLYVYNYLDIMVLRYFDRIITVSAILKEELVKNNISEDRIQIIENSQKLNTVETKIRNNIRNDINVKSHELLIGYVGRLSIEKGIVYLLDAFRTLCEITETLKLVIIGDGPIYNELMLKARLMDLSSRIIFTGFKDNIYDWYKAIDIFVLPSFTEGTPMVLLEAMSHGIPCIATNVGGIPNIIDNNVDGILVPPGNAKEISSAIIRLVTNLCLRTKISSQAKMKINEKYNLDRWIKRIENAYLDLYDNYSFKNSNKIKIAKEHN